MSEPVSTIDGWYSLHLLYSVDWAGLRVLDKDERNALTEELQTFLNRQEEVHEKHEGDYAFYNIMGHKADIIFWLLRPTADELIKLELEINKLRVADYLIPTYSYVSIIEMSSYLGGNKTPEEMMEIPHIQQRLYPSLEKSKYICFYPMDKKREWFSLPVPERQRMMASHGKIGASYADKLGHYVANAFGLDDYHWGVTLWGNDFDEFKNIVYEMRFDEASAVYGIFPYFILGEQLHKDDLNMYFLGKVN